MSDDNGHIHAAPGPAAAPAPGPRCSRCGEPIGVYEPLIAIERGRARRTSRAAEPEIATTPGEYRHLACHERRAEPPPEPRGSRTKAPLQAIRRPRRAVLSVDRDLSR